MKGWVRVRVIKKRDRKIMDMLKLPV